jgi:hypothetical protein
LQQADEELPPVYLQEQKELLQVRHGSRCSSLILLRRANYMRNPGL